MRNGVEMKIIRADALDWEPGKGYEKRKMLEGAGVQGSFSYIQEVRFRDGESVSPHFHHKQTEIFYFLEKGSLIMKGENLDLQAGDIVVCEPSDVHEVPPVEKEFSILVIKLDHEEDDTTWMEG